MMGKKIKMILTRRDVEEWIVEVQREIKTLNSALDLIISRTMGKEIDDPGVQEMKKNLIEKVKRSK